jgi:hypothetical protein
MNKREYKKKVAELFSFKSPKSERFKKLTQSDETVEKQIDTPDKGEKKDEDDMAPSTPKTASDIALYGKKRDVIIIGAGLSGKFSRGA